MTEWKGGSPGWGQTQPAEARGSIAPYPCLSVRGEGIGRRAAIRPDHGELVVNSSETIVKMLEFVRIDFIGHWFNLSVDIFKA